MTGLQYIGSTTKLLCQRLGQHRSNYKSYLKGTSHYVTSFKILENDDYSIILIENYPCKNKEELCARERYYIDSIGCVNKVVPQRTRHQYRKDNKENIKQYYIENKIYLNEKCQCSCGVSYIRRSKARHNASKRHQEYFKLLEICTNFRKQFKVKYPTQILE